MKIFVLGWTGYGNVGDEAYVQAFPTLFPSHEFQFGNKVEDWVASWADEVWVGGGNIIHPDFLGPVIPLHGVLPVRLMSVGYASPEVTGDDLKPFASIWVRDVASEEKVKALGVDCTLAPDAAWVMDADRQKGNDAWDKLFDGSDLYTRRVVVVLNAYLTAKQPDLLGRDFVRWHSFADDLREVFDSTSASFAFVPMGRRMSADDRVPNSWVAHRCKYTKKNAVVYSDSWSPQHTLDFISAADVVISQRLHSTIFSMLGGVPVIDITHHAKNKGFLDSVGFSDHGLDYWDFSRTKFKELLNNILENTDFYREKVDGITTSQKLRLGDYVANIF